MISVIVQIEDNNASSLARTLENLVPYAVEGFVQDVTILHEGLDGTSAKLADEAGCKLQKMPTDMEKVIDGTRGEWLLFIEAGAELLAGWADVVAAHANADGGAAAFKIAVSNDRTWWKRFFYPLTTNNPIARGFLISKRQARANIAGKTAVDGLMRGLAIKRIRVGIRPA